MRTTEYGLFREADGTATRYSIDALKSIWLVDARRINFRGTHGFPIDRYADRLGLVRRSAYDDSLDRKRTRSPTGVCLTPIGGIGLPNTLLQAHVAGSQSAHRTT